MMFDELGNSADFFDDEALQLVDELAANTPEELRRKRSNFRLAIKAPVIAQPGNASDLTKLKIKGLSGDLSEGGFAAVFPLPLRVGDVYRIQFDRAHVDLPLTFARCVRCRLVREDAFEAGFYFFGNISLPANLEGAEASRLVT